MKEFELKYGCNPNQKPSKIYMEDGSELPMPGQSHGQRSLAGYSPWHHKSRMRLSERRPPRFTVALEHCPRAVGRASRSRQGRRPPVAPPFCTVLPPHLFLLWSRHIALRTPSCCLNPLLTRAVRLCLS